MKINEALKINCKNCVFLVEDEEETTTDDRFKQPITTVADMCHLNSRKMAVVGKADKHWCGGHIHRDTKVSFREALAERTSLFFEEKEPSDD